MSLKDLRNPFYLRKLLFSILVLLAGCLILSRKLAIDFSVSLKRWEIESAVRTGLIRIVVFIGWKRKPGTYPRIILGPAVHADFFLHVCKSDHPDGRHKSILKWANLPQEERLTNLSGTGQA